MVGIATATCLAVLATAAPAQAPADTVFTVERRVELGSRLPETSALAFSEGRLYTINDSRDGRLYQVDTLTGAVVGSRRLTDGDNEDWEALALRGDTVYVGDFGNNARGNRRDLRILRFYLGADTAALPPVDTIGFSYAEQVDFAPAPANTTDFDAEAMAVTPDSIYVFTKEWSRLGTAVYALPNAAGQHVARMRGRLDSIGLITDADYRPGDSLLVLSGYSPALQPFVYAGYGFRGRDFFGGRAARAQVDLPFHQVEGIGSLDGRRYFLSNERFERSIVLVPQALSVLDLGGLLDGLRRGGTSATQEGLSPKRGLHARPNPTDSTVWVSGSRAGERYDLRDAAGRQVLSGTQAADDLRLDFRALPQGTYLLRTEHGGTVSIVRR